MIVGAETGTETEKLSPLEIRPLGVTTVIGPLVAPSGTFVVSWPSELTENGALAPLNVTAVAPVNALPTTCTYVPTGPPEGVKPLSDGATGATAVVVVVLVWVLSPLALEVFEGVVVACVVGACVVVVCVAVVCVVVVWVGVVSVG